ncbi:hypothetical protein [Pedobacter nyackensis]|uniref:Uncharacterized protein n=1 Tax=Pedobacter nyackensis TaxID=475255 RepID=A0A1W2DKX0_9SPHI|nr:hypothetical protein [Pedobacter nyackensis]SMC98085.1 hypothetical protein SAMN04488101_107136 [Pedobacter nyackensis]
MKKLFFTALVAVVAVGGAYAQVIPVSINQGGPQTGTCESSGDPSCAVENTYYIPDESTAYTAAELAGTFYNEL